MFNLNRTQRVLSILSTCVLGLAMSCTGTFGSDDFEEAESPATLTAAHLTFDNSAISASFEPIADGRQRVTCQFTNFIGDAEVVASLIAPGTTIDFLDPTTQGATPALDVTIESLGQFEATYIVEDSSYFDLEFNCRGEVRENGRTKVEEDTVRFFQLKSLFGAVRGANLMDLNEANQSGGAFGLNATSTDKKAPKIALRNPKLEAEPIETFFGETVSQACVTDDWIYYYNGSSVARGKPGENMVQKFAGDIVEAANSKNRLRFNIRKNIELLRGNGWTNLSSQKLSCSDKGATVWFHVLADPSDIEPMERVVGIEFLESTIIPKIHAIPTVTSSEILQYPSSSSGFVVLKDSSGIFKANKTHQKFDQIPSSSLSSVIPELDDAVAAQSGINPGFAYAKLMGTTANTYEFLSAGIYRVCSNPGNCTDDVRVELTRKTIPTNSQPQTETLKTADYNFTDTLELETVSGAPGNASKILKTVVLGEKSYHLHVEILRSLEFDFHDLNGEQGLGFVNFNLLRQFGQYRYEPSIQRYFELKDDNTSLGSFANGSFSSETVIRFQQMFPGYDDNYPENRAVIHFLLDGNTLTQTSYRIEGIENTTQESSFVYNFTEEKLLARYDFLEILSIAALTQNIKYLAFESGFATKPAVTSAGRVIISTFDTLHGRSSTNFFQLDENGFSPTNVSADPSLSFDVDMFLFETPFRDADTTANQSQVQTRLGELEATLTGCTILLSRIPTGDGYVYYSARCGESMTIHQLSKDGSHFQTTLPNGSQFYAVSGNDDLLTVAFSSGGRKLKIIDKATGSAEEIPMLGQADSMYLTNSHIYVQLGAEIHTVQYSNTSGLSLSPFRYFFGNDQGRSGNAFLTNGCSLNAREFVAKDVNTLANNMAKFCSGTVIDMHMRKVSATKSKLVVKQRLRNNLNFMEINIKDL